MDEKANQQETQETIGLLVHSYNNYLSGLMGFTELALLECEQDVVKERLNLALDSGKEAVIFGKQLLSSIGRLQVKMVPVDLKTLLNELVAQSPDLKLINSKSVSQSELFIKTNKDWFLYCLNALVEFCQDYSKDKSITIKLSSSKDAVSIQVLSKVQLNTEQQTKLFTPFYSSRTLLGKKDIGLAMINGFVAQMGGELIWTNQDGFLFSLVKAADPE